MKRFVLACTLAAAFSATACEKSAEEADNAAAEPAATEEEGSATQGAANDEAGDEAAEAPEDDGVLTAEEAMDSLPNISPVQLHELAAAEDVWIFDANSQSTRDEKGHVPGAILLTSASEYQISTLPEETESTLVFYCGGPSCMAAPRAAAKASNAGYTDVRIMREGISGWVDAELTVAQLDAE